MSKNLVIVESPAKAKTIQKYLGPEFTLLASYGHVRDLLPKEGAVDVNNHFAMRYELIEKNKKRVAAIISAMKKADALYLATDPDREGEAISWHILEILNQENILGDKPVYRIVFHEITRQAIQGAVANPRDIAMSLVNAQQARRALDYLVGFNLSPLLWRKVRRGLSAGRVQSPALRLIVEREEAIEKFVSQEYWDIIADNAINGQAFQARLVVYQGEKLEQFSMTSEAEAEGIKENLLKIAQGKLTVSKVVKKQRKRQPAAPFITSTLQQEAARKLGFTAQRTMRIAQQLYEGIDIGSGIVGLISYMRTDSVNLAAEAIAEIRTVIQERYGENNLPPEPRIYRTKSKNAQEAHEAIRPTGMQRLPEDLKGVLTPEQYKLYRLIWRRTIACQMINALFNTVMAELQCGENNYFRANGSVLVEPGFMHVYQEGLDEKTGEDDEKLLPALAENDEVSLQDIQGKQHFTEPLPRYSEALLIKSLEEHGIGRPSTYASIVSTLLYREYVALENKRFRPLDIGRIVNRFLTQHFTQYVDYDFTAKLEDELDAVSRGERDYEPLLASFWTPFKAQIEDVLDRVQRKDVTQEDTNETCPLCAKPLKIRLGKHSRFIGCTGYPECKYTRSLEDKSEGTDAPDAIQGRQCPSCQGALQIKHGKYGKFIGCANYPDCKHIEPLQKPANTGVVCPTCSKGHLLKRKSRYGKIFYSCEHYPDCTYAIWNEPLAEKCPKCHWPILMIKTTKRYGTQKACPNQPCKYVESYEMPESEEDNGAS